ncbi:uncharacterized protein TRIREDRAFT_52960 [Trichoderma reesei QM6a]|uniref:Predicted protein n=2 Tax=Hypocrea jecorina TaxID=51453 RepID=G0R905_HYPJQ|nr:uncharacterized protein TRIREDRAFT_52960 [Trichoderma reesei QM6a]EGR52140.1 predicted protein [Trichoderma reesei QM6a]ETS06186.1 hypothetical protein M419DRAFT_70140 [Trichoderma reesei RUT C-30]
MSTGAYWPAGHTSSLYPSEYPQGIQRPVATVMWDYQHCIPLDQIPTRDLPVLLLTPVVVPPVGNDPTDNRDPFEILGQTLSARNIPINHVPYTKNQGITGVHVAFIRRARAVIFVITNLAGTDGQLQLGFSELVARACESRPLINLVCCNLAGQNISSTQFRTLVHITGFTNSDLLVAAALLLDGCSRPTVSVDTGTLAPSASDAEPTWSVSPWIAERDLAETCALWQACLPRQFHLSASALGSLLKRDGYALHYVVREPAGGSLVGFCAAYATFADSSDVALIGSIAAIIVQAEYRGQGIGSSLHEAAMNRLHGVRGVQRLHLGTTFPRLFCGLTADMADAGQWFARKGWPVNALEHGGQGGLVSDWLLRFTDLTGALIPYSGLGFRLCHEGDAHDVLDLENRPPATTSHGFGWYDQYARTLDSEYRSDIIVAFDHATIVATAITFVPGQQSPAATDIPWPESLNSNVGGVTCICING